MFTDKTTQSVADAVKKIMEADAQKKVEEALIGAQKNIDKNHNNKIDAQDFKILKGQKKAVKTEEVVKEEVQQLNEVKLADLPVRKIEGKSYGKNYVDPEGADDAADKPSKKKVSKGTYASRATRGFETPAAKAKRDAKIAMRRESFTDLLNSYQENGIKGLFESFEKIASNGRMDEEIAGWIAHFNGQKHEIKKHEAKDLWDAKQKAIAHFKAPKSKHGLIAIKPAYNEAIEEDSTEEVKKQLDDAQAKSEGKKTQPDLSKGSVQAVKSESVEEEVELDEADTYSIKNSDKTYHVSKYPITSNHSIYKKIKAADPKAQIHKNGQPVKEEVEQIEERTLTAAETGKKEEIVKSMKKGLAGFKERYGKDAKSVIYATATKQAKKD